MEKTTPPHLTKTKIIGLAGLAGVGKDTALTLLKLQHRTAGLAFADPMRAMIEALFANTDTPRRYMQHRRYKEAVIPQLGVSYRRLVQTLGTEWGLNCLAEDFWTRIADARLAKLQQLRWEAIAITDVRTASEAAWVRSKGGLVWHIHRPQATPVLAHITEEMPFLADRTVMNDRGIAEFSVALREALDCYDTDKALAATPGDTQIEGN